MPDLFAHRGFAAEFPENTLAAVRGAAAAGAHVVEVDVRRAGSGDLVVIHDTTVDRVTGATGAVEAYTATELRDLDVLDSGEGIPTLAAVVAELPGDVGLNVELKEEGLVPDTYRQLERVDGPVVVSSFLETALEEFRDVAPTVSRALLVDRRPRTAVDRAQTLDCRFLHPRARLCLRSLVVRRAHDVGLAVNAWTVRSKRMASWLTRVGVDGLIADSPTVLT